MGDQINPLVKGSATQTLDQIINTLQYVGTSLDKVANDENEDDTAYLSTTQAAGLRNIIDGLQNAAEVCAGQCYQLESRHNP